MTVFDAQKAVAWLQGKFTINLQMRPTDCFPCVTAALSMLQTSWNRPIFKRPVSWDLCCLCFSHFHETLVDDVMVTFMVFLIMFFAQRMRASIRRLNCKFWALLQSHVVDLSGEGCSRTPAFKITCNNCCVVTKHQEVTCRELNKETFTASEIILFFLQNVRKCLLNKSRSSH